MAREVTWDSQCPPAAWAAVVERGPVRVPGRDHRRRIRDQQRGDPDLDDEQHRRQHQRDLDRLARPHAAPPSASSASIEIPSKPEERQRGDGHRAEDQRPGEPVRVEQRAEAEPAALAGGERPDPDRRGTGPGPADSHTIMNVVNPAVILIPARLITVFTATNPTSQTHTGTAGTEALTAIPATR